MANGQHVQPTDPAHYVTPREGETKLGEVIARVAPDAGYQSGLDRPERDPGYQSGLERADAGYQSGLARLYPDPDYKSELDRLYRAGARVALIGVPESIGPQANLGRPGAELGWHAFLRSFLNLQANRAIPAGELALIGAVDCGDLMLEAAGVPEAGGRRTKLLRELCETVDERVRRALLPLYRTGFEVILIGGGHNNAYPLLTALHEEAGTPCGAVNLDPHADFRPREGRHSGNGFSYAYAGDALGYYHVFGLHEGRNSEAILAGLSEAGFDYHSIHRLYADADFAEAVTDVRSAAASWEALFGIEVDVDAIRLAPASATNAAGVTVAQAYHLVARLASLPDARYLHLPEAAPALHPAGEQAGMVVCGQILTELTLAYLHGRAQR